MKTTYNRRSFLKASALSGGGFMLGISFLSGFKSGKNAATGIGEITNLPLDFNQNHVT